MVVPQSIQFYASDRQKTGMVLRAAAENYRENKQADLAAFFYLFLMLGILFIACFWCQDGQNYFFSKYPNSLLLVSMLDTIRVFFPLNTQIVSGWDGWSSFFGKYPKSDESILNHPAGAQVPILLHVS